MLKDCSRAVTNGVPGSILLKDSLSKERPNSPATGGGSVGSPLVPENWVSVQQIESAASAGLVCVTRCCLFAPPSVSPDSPLPCFAKAVPVSSTNKRFSGYILFRAQPRGRRWVRNRTFGRSDPLSTVSCCVGVPLFSFLWDRSPPSPQFNPAAHPCRTSPVVANPGFMPPPYLWSHRWSQEPAFKAA